MNKIKKIIVKSVGNLAVVVLFMIVIGISADMLHAASTPSLILSNNGSTIRIAVTGADGNSPILFYYPTNSDNTSFVSIDIGMTAVNGSFGISVAPNSYGLNGGSPVYVSVNGALSTRVNWPSAPSSQGSGTLRLSRSNTTLFVGETINIFAMQSANSITLSSNTNPAVLSASLVPSDNSIFVNALSAGSTVLTICAGTDGCGTVNITVQSTNQKVSFSQAQVSVVMGQSPQTINVYGPGTYYGLTNSNRDAISATLDGSALSIHGIAVGQGVISLCATGWSCGSITVNVLSSGSVAPTAVTLPAPDYSNKPPQVANLTISSNNVNGMFYGVGSTLNISFKSNQSVTNVRASISGKQLTVNSSDNGYYNFAYTFTGSETKPIPVAIAFENASGLTGRSYLSLSDTTVSGAITTPTTSTNSTSNNNSTFNKYLYMGMTKTGVSDPEVVALQNHLKTVGLYSGPITGYFGPTTKKAVEAYQKKNGLSTLGVVGPSTRVLLNQGK